MKVTTINGGAHRAIQLVEMKGDPQEPLAVATFGLHGTGKTRLAATAPGPIGLVPLDRKTRQTMLRVSNEFGRKVVIPDADLFRADNPMLLATLKPDCGNKSKVVGLTGQQPDCCAIHAYRFGLNRIKDVIFRMAEDDNLRSIVIDSATNLWDDILFANHGRTDHINPRDRGPDNREMQELLAACSSKNLVLTHKSKEIWKAEKPTGRFEWDGYKHLGYETNVIVEQMRSPNPTEDGWTYKLQTKMCQANAALSGLDLLFDDSISFKSLAEAIYPEAPDGYFD